eukprot:evm.model.NODE_4935_length_22065_cov_15.706367.7
MQRLLLVSRQNLLLPATAAVRGSTPVPIVAVGARRGLASAVSDKDEGVNAPTTFSHEKMARDKRYKPQSEIPKQVLESMHTNEVHSPGFSIRGEAREGRAAYLDFQATTPMDPRVVDAMLPFMTGSFGNPHSRTHAYGWEAEAAVEKAREQVASILGASSKEIVFTSGATESNNAAIKGVAHFYKEKKNHIITTQIEHKCVLDSCRVLEQEGFKVTYLPVQKNGLLDLQVLKDAITPQTSLVSVMAVNNEIGVLQPMREIGKICRDNKVFFHSDLAQMVGKLPIDVDEMKIDLASLSSFGAACEIAKKELPHDEAWIHFLANRLYEGIKKNIPHVILNGDEQARYEGCLNISFAYVEGESLLMALKNIAVSSGSACTSASLEPSYVLRAIGVGEDLAHTSIRFGIGRFTTMEEVDFTIDILSKNVARLREMSPLYELVMEGVDLSSIQWTQDAHH